MTPQQKQLIRELVQKYSEHLGTESLLAYVAETSGMPAAGKTLIQSIKTSDSRNIDWLFRDCLKYNVVFHLFVEEITRLIDLLDTQHEDEDYCATLSISSGSGQDEIKQSHPEAASSLHRDRLEKFIAINRNYNDLSTAQDTEEGSEKTAPSRQWQQNRARRVSIGQRKKLYMWSSAALVILLIVSTVVLITTQNRVMLAGLQKGRTVIAASVDRVLGSIQFEAVADRSHEQQRVVEKNDFATPSPSQKPLLAVPEKKTDPIIQKIEQPKGIGKIPLQPPLEQLAPDPVTIASNATLPDAQRRTVVTKSPDTIDILEAAPAVVKITKQHLKIKKIPLQPTPEKLSPKPVTIANNTRLPEAQKPAVITKSPDTIKIQPDIQSRIDTFLDNYMKAHQQRNLILLSNFFEADAVENGKQFTSMVPKYKELFATTSDISLKVEKTSWQQLEGKIDVRGIFKFSAQYSDSHTFTGTGPIRFVLMNNNNSFRVSALEYDFVGDN